MYIMVAFMVMSPAAEAVTILENHTTYVRIAHGGSTGDNWSNLDALLLTNGLDFRLTGVNEGSLDAEMETIRLSFGAFSFSPLPVAIIQRIDGTTSSLRYRAPTGFGLIFNSGQSVGLASGMFDLADQHFDGTMIVLTQTLIPEPSTFTLLALGTLACGHTARKRRKRLQSTA